MTWREFRNLVDLLPPESHTHTALRLEYEAMEDQEEPEDGSEPIPEPEPGNAPWSKQEILQAQLIDAVNWNTYAIQQWIAMNSEGSDKPNEPEPTPRPGVYVNKRIGKREVNVDVFNWLMARANDEDPDFNPFDMSTLKTDVTDNNDRGNIAQ